MNQREKLNENCYMVADWLVKEYLFDYEVNDYTLEMCKQDIHTIRDIWKFPLAENVKDVHVRIVYEYVLEMRKR